MFLRNLLVGLAFSSGCYTLLATDIKVSGTVVDNMESPIEFANVTLLSSLDSTYIAGTVTDTYGKFEFRDSMPHSVIMRITYMGFNDLYIDNPAGNVGVVSLVSNAIILDEVEVKSFRPVAKLKNDGISVAIKGSYLAHSGSASDLIGKMPFVAKSGQGIEVLGKGSPAVYINGRQVRDLSELERLSSSEIETVDIVTTPGVQYASTVNAVIRIKTIAPVGEGLSLNDRTTLGYKHYTYLFEQLDFNYRVGGYDFFGNVNYENYRERTAYHSLTSQQLNYRNITRDNEAQEYTKYPVYQGRLGMNYTRGNLNCGFYYDFALRQESGYYDSHSLRLVEDILSDELENNSEITAYNRQHMFSAYYAGKMSDWNLTANLDAIWQINDRKGVESELSVTNAARYFTTNNNVANRLLAANVAASLPVASGNLNFGTEISDINRTDLYQSNADYITGNDTKIQETTTALFVDATQKVGKAQISTGLRWEYTDSRFYISGIQQQDRSRCYTDIAPSAGVALPLGNVNAKVSYSRKTTRPAFEQLRSAVKYIDRYSYESGNPNLLPVYRDYLTASVIWKDLVVELNYHSTKNYFMWQTMQYPGNPEATLLIMENMPRFNSYTAMAYYSPAIGCWKPALMVALSKTDFELWHNNKLLKLNKPIGIFKFNNAIRLPYAVLLNVDLSARTSGNGDNLYLGSYWTCNVALYKSFARETLDMRLSLNDLFGTWRQQFTLYDAISVSAVEKIYDTRDLLLTIRYHFNAAKSRYKGTGAGHPTKSRL